jgi:bifunctional DNA-binding transcriptional regulator/antitoxin component of YhaV-PrlF toxin-antitoxin module
MPSKRLSERAAAATSYSYVGNIGCIRFPVPIRKASGIKRGDRLELEILADGSLVLEKLGPLDGLPEEAVEVEGCACQKAPAGCGGGPEVLMVGWSYVRFNAARAAELGLLADVPIKLVGEPQKITVSLHHKLQDLEGVPRSPCPP